MKLLLGISLLVTLPVLAQTSGLDTTPSRTIRLNTAAQIAPLSATRIDNLLIGREQLQSKEAQHLRDQSVIQGRAGGAGGDDVGNGGDELRQNFMAQATQVLQDSKNETLKNRLLPLVNIRRLVVVNGLEIAGAKEAIAVRATVAEGIIFLDSESWSPVNGLLAESQDSRFQTLSLLNQAAGAPFTQNDLLKAWNKNGARSAKIWCPFIKSNYGEVRKKHSYEATHRTSAKLAEDSALELCRQSKMVECRISSIVMRGSGRGMIHHAVASGYEIKVERKSGAVLKRERCEAARACEVVHEWAPRGQVTPAEFAEIEGEIGATCR